MWFFFGLITLIGSCLWAGRLRYDARWQGEPWGPVLFKVLRRHKSQKLHSVTVAIKTATPLDFELKRETWFDRLFKWTGLSREFQLGKDAFDKEIYIVSDDERVWRFLRQSRSFVDEVHACFSAHAHRQFSLRRITCRAGLVRMEFRPRDSQSNYIELLGWAQGRLEAVRDALPGKLVAHEPERDPYFLKSILVLALSTGLAIHGFLHLLRLSFRGVFTVDLAQLWSYSLVLAMVLVVGLVAATVVLLRGTARLHLVLVEVILVGSFGATATAFVELRDFNMDFDYSVPNRLATTVQGKSTSYSRRSGRSYRLVVADWNGSNSSERIRVGSDAYHRTSIGDDVIVSQRAGALGVRWVDGISSRQAAGVER